MDDPDRIEVQPLTRDQPLKRIAFLVGRPPKVFEPDKSTKVGMLLASRLTAQGSAMPFATPASDSFKMSDWDVKLVRARTP